MVFSCSGNAEAEAEFSSIDLEIQTSDGLQTKDKGPQNLEWSVGQVNSMPVG